MRRRWQSVLIFKRYPVLRKQDAFCVHLGLTSLCFYSPDKATNPLNRQEDWEYIIGFCDQINKELEGPQIAVRLLAHKIQSPQEWEAVQALTVLEACMKNCGQRFHNEVGKFRFLNELIKVVSPKYLGDRVSEKVKSKIIELLYSWTVALPDESKIKDAYYMLKRQGIVLSDPVIPAESTLIPSPPARPKNPVFDDEEKSKLLAKLLKSKNPDDLQEANKLIKSMVKEDEARIQKVTKRMHTLEEVNNNVKLLNEMLVHYSKEDSSEADKELMKELYDRCETKRRTLFKLASETEDNDSTLGDILQASDNLSRVINTYKRIIEGQVVNGEVDIPGLPPTDGDQTFISVLQSTVFHLFPPLQNEPVDLDFLNPKPASVACNSPLLPALSQPTGRTSASLASTFTAPQPAPTSAPFIFSAAAPLGPSSAMSGAPGYLGSAMGSFLLLSPASFQQQGSPLKGPEISLGNVHVPLESIKPSSALPVTAYDKNGLRILLHFAKECPPGRPDVLVVVVSMLNTAPLPIKNIVLQAAVPKSMKVKLQPPSGTELAPFNPIQPPAAITQVMLLANPRKEKVRLRYRLTFALGDQPSTEVGEVDQFPPVEQWGNL
uniref:Golgi associated, gamma adaptin ear containing, ARF binding protein 3 n=1 Tax=Podarcis muralis TaxID=64176 RepID=A0A670JFF9_PODMU